MGTKNVLKGTMCFGLSLVSSLRGATTVAKVKLFSTWTRSTVSFYSIVRKLSEEYVDVSDKSTNFFPHVIH